MASSNSPLLASGPAFMASASADLARLSLADARSIFSRQFKLVSLPVGHTAITVYMYSITAGLS